MRGDNTNSRKNNRVRRAARPLPTYASLLGRERQCAIGPPAPRTERSPDGSGSGGLTSPYPQKRAPPGQPEAPRAGSALAPVPLRLYCPASYCFVAA